MPLLAPVRSTVNGSSAPESDGERKAMMTSRRRKRMGASGPRRGRAHRRCLRWAVRRCNHRPHVPAALSTLQSVHPESCMNRVALAAVLTLVVAAAASCSTSGAQTANTANTANPAPPPAAPATAPPVFDLAAAMSDTCRGKERNRERYLAALDTIVNKRELTRVEEFYASDYRNNSAPSGAPQGPAAIRHYLTLL